MKMLVCLDFAGNRPWDADWNRGECTADTHSPRIATMTDKRPGAGPMPDRVPQPERQVAFRLGISAESRAAAFLIAKGYRILARRWRSPVGEIDIIARRRQLLVFVEVKARENFDDAAWSVTDRQRARIAAAAEAWLARQGDHDFQDMRFDAVLVAPGRIPRHIPAAFDAGR
jgi:putative endonuclease